MKRICLDFTRCLTLAGNKIEFGQTNKDAEAFLFVPLSLVGAYYMHPQMHVSILTKIYYAMARAL